MQDTVTGRLESIPGDDPKNVKPGWPVFRIGERFKVRGWWWRVEGFTEDGGLHMLPVEKVKKPKASANWEERAALQRDIESMRSKHPANKRRGR